MKNVRPKPNTPTETRTIQSRTQTAKPNSHLASNDSTGYRNPILPQTRGSSHAPPQRIPQRGQERCWRGIGDRNPLSLSNRPREEQIKSTEAMRYSSLKKPIETPPKHRRFLLKNPYPALPPRRRRMAPSSRSRTIFSCQGRNHIGEQPDLHKLHPYPSPS